METLIVILGVIIIALVFLCLSFRKEAKADRIEIEVYKVDGYLAQIKKRPEIYATGDTFYDAVGELVNSNRKLFRVEYIDDHPINKSDCNKTDGTK